MLLVEPEIWIEYHRISKLMTLTQRINAEKLNNIPLDPNGGLIPVRITYEKETGDTVFRWLM